MTAEIIPFTTKRQVQEDPESPCAREALFCAIDDLMLGQSSASSISKMTDYLLGRLAANGFMIVPLP
jgi:hypothetical protein